MAGPLFCSVSTISESGLPCSNLPEKTVENVMIPHTRLPKAKETIAEERENNFHIEKLHLHCLLKHAYAFNSPNGHTDLMQLFASGASMPIFITP